MSPGANIPHTNTPRTNTPHPITAFERRRASGWPLTMHVVALGGGDLLIHSPTFIDDDTFSRIEELGTPRILFAPNHFHHLSLRRYRERFPRAVCTATATAIPRLRTRGHENVLPTHEVELPATVRWIEPEGTRAGEAWVAIDHPTGPTFIVCDAFFNEPRPIPGLEGTMLRLSRASPGLSVGITFTLLCVRDAARYGKSVRDLLERERPNRIVFSHGDPIETGGAERLTEVLRARIGM